MVVGCRVLKSIPAVRRIPVIGGLIGPAAVMAAGTMGAGAMAAFLLAGAWFGYALLWVILLMVPVFVASADTASRIGALNPQAGLFHLTRTRISAPLAWLILLLVVPVHFLVSMGQLSVMSSALLNLFSLDASATGRASQVVLSLGLAVFTLWLVLSRGYERMQHVMTVLMVLMLLCFVTVALRGLTDWRSILPGTVPALPADLPLDGGGVREASTSIIAMVGSAIAPAALLGLPYLSADAGGGQADLANSLRQSILNLGLVFGAYAMLVVIAGAYALHGRPDHASFDDVAQAATVFGSVLPGVLAPLGPLLFTLGLFTAAMTTLVVAVQVTIYFVLDMAARPWRFTPDNRQFAIALTVFTLGAAALAPLWEFPALLKVILLMGVNVVVMPAVYLVVLLLSNRRSVMRANTNGPLRNLLLLAGLGASCGLAINKAPNYWTLLTGPAG